MKKIREISGWVIVLLCIIGMAGCFTQKKAAKQLGHINYAYPELIAGNCAALFPVVAKKGKTDTIYRPADNKDLSDSLNNLRKSYFDLYQTYEDALLAATGDTSCQNIIRSMQVKLDNYRRKIEQMQRDYIPCKPDTLYLPRVDTVPDLAAIAVRDAQISNLKADRDNWKAKAENRGKWNWYLSIGLVLSIGWNFRKLIFKMFV